MKREYLQLPNQLRAEYVWDYRTPDHCYVEVHYKERRREVGQKKAMKNASQSAGLLTDILKEKGIAIDINRHFASRLNKIVDQHDRWLEHTKGGQEQCALEGMEFAVGLYHMALDTLKNYEDLPHVVAVRKEIRELFSAASDELRQIGGNPDDVVQDEALRERLANLSVWSHLDYVPIPDLGYLSFSCHLPQGEQSLPAFEETLKQAAMILPMREQQMEAAARQERKQRRKTAIREGLQNFSGSLIMEHNIDDISNEVYRALARDSRRGRGGEGRQ